MSKHLTTYLGGYMEFGRGSGISWRHKLTLKLHEIFNKHITIQDPTQDEKKKTGMDVGDAKVKLNYWKKHENIDAIKEMMYNVIKADIEAIDRSDFIVIYWDKDIPTYGTIGEIQHAYDNNIPIYFVYSGELKYLSSWIIGEYTLRFNSFDTLVDFLVRKYSDFVEEG